MKKHIHYLLAALFATTTVFAQDTIVFKNGDVLTGTIIKQDSKHVHFETGSFGSVTLNTPDIAEIRIGTTEQRGEDIATETVPTPQKIGASPQVPNPWSGQAGVAIAMREKTLSDSTGVYSEEKYETYRLYGNVNWKGLKNNLDWNWTYRYSEDETKIRDDYLNITQKYNYNFKSSYYAEAKTVYQRDYNRNIENEYLQSHPTLILVYLKFFGHYLFDIHYFRIVITFQYFIFIDIFQRGIVSQSRLNG